MQAKYLAILSSISILWVSSLNIGIRELKGDKSINLLKVQKKKLGQEDPRAGLALLARCQIISIHEDGREKI